MSDANNVLSTELFYGMILSGAKQVIHSEGNLNQLNVFPVADRDTGTNLASMMRYIVENLSPAKDIQELLHQLSQHGLIGCCGNSGLIFSQFFYGLTQYKLTEKLSLKANDFVEMMASGYKSAYHSVSSPKPGTILTVMDRWVNGYRDILANAKLSVVDSFNSSMDKANEALKETMNQLEILRTNHVVDAGAQGFVNFLEGMQRFLTGTDEQREKILADHQLDNSDIKLNHEFEDVTEVPNFRYCFETVIKTQNIDVLDAYMEQFNQLGDSIVVGKGPQMVKIHIHTNEPETVTQILTKTGDVIYQKIDDMMLQYNIANKPRRSKVAIVTDTMADIPEAVMREHNIYRIPMQVKINNNSFLDKVSINYRQTLDYLGNPQNNIGTAAPSAAIVARTFQFLEQYYESIIVVTVGKSLSSSHDVIVNQARKFKDTLISVVDSGMNSAPQGLLVAYAMNLAESGQFNHEEIVVKLEQAKRGANVLIMLNSLEGMIRSGRLSKSMGFIAKLLRLKPLIHIDEATGKAKVIGAAFTKSGGWRKLTKMVNQLYDTGKLKTLAVVHSDSPHHGDIFAKYVKRHTGLMPIYTTDVSSVSGIHTDINSFSIGYVNTVVNVKD
ncbi:MAG: DegV family EDD domain-containing protein [Proteobacteria bacterium]|nr:MAG: DegV family EDD domain-containing protein [Pseudomonadota bacterium]